MAYQVLARKWRPQDFDSLIGQEPIVTALRNALTEGRIAQAYLFSGIRGVGKTTAARLLAKALNCEQGPTATPCNECVQCVEITRGSDLDVIEVDAATYSKVEQVRELTENLRYGPARDRYKVVVLDEIHRLSRQAFDALLKIIEEPPPHLVFVFATTEIEAVPATVLSRCQEFHFRRVPADVVAAHLGRLAESEDIETSETALRLIARAGEGSVRDAVALLDQMATFGSGTISDDEAVRLLGGLDLELFRQLLGHILAGEPAGVGRAVARVEEEGWDPRNVYGQFLAYCRDALHLAMAGPGSESRPVELPREEAEALARLARGAGYENLLRVTHQLLASEPVVRRSEAGVLAVEIALLRAAELPKLTRIEELLGGVPEARQRSEPAPAPQASTSRPVRPERSEEPPGDDEPPPEPPPDVETGGEPSAPPAEPGPPGEGTVEAFLELLNRRRAALAARFRRHDLGFEDGSLSIRVPAEDVERLESNRNQEILRDCVREIWGTEARYQLVPVQRPPREEPGGQPKEDEVSEDETVQAVLDLFSGTVESVEEKTPRDTMDERSPTGDNPSHRGDRG